jgi:hypothetical protein
MTTPEDRESGSFNIGGLGADERRHGLDGAFIGRSVFRAARTLSPKTQGSITFIKSGLGGAQAASSQRLIYTCACASPQ